MALPAELCKFRPKGEPGKKRCVLSIDGGGVRGIMAAVILEALESELQRLDGADARIADYFDIIAGTSTGSLVASLLVLPDPETKRPRYTAEEITAFYFKIAAEIFQKSGFWWHLRPRWLDPFIGPIHSAVILESSLKNIFGDLKLSKTVKPVLIPSYDIKLQVSRLFSTAQAKSKQLPDCYIRDVCRSSTAAPTYFPPYYFSTHDNGQESQFNMVDGGLAANNPTYLAVCELLKDQREGEKLKCKDLLVLSLGTGQNTVSYDAKTISRWGMGEWISYKGKKPLLDILMMASQDIADYSMSNAFFEQRCQDNYLRIQEHNLSDTQMQMDDASEQNLKSLVATAKALLQSKVQTRNQRGQFEEHDTTYQDRIIQYAEWLVEVRKAHLTEPDLQSDSLCDHVQVGKYAGDTV